MILFKYSKYLWTIDENLKAIVDTVSVVIDKTTVLLFSTLQCVD